MPPSLFSHLYLTFVALSPHLQPADASVSQKVGVDRAFVMRQARGIRAGGPQGALHCSGAGSGKALHWCRHGSGGCGSWLLAQAGLRSS